MDTTAYTWSTLATVGGTAAATLLIVQYLKVPLDKVWKIPTRVFVFLVSFLIMLGASAFSNTIALQDVPLIAVNSFVSALTAMGGYEATFAKSDTNKTE